MGLEALVARELHALGYPDARAANGLVAFGGDWSAVARANLWLRTGERVLIRVGRFAARTFDELFDQTKALPWDELLPEDALFPVDGKSHDSTLTSVPACQAVAKKAVVEALKRRYKRDVFAETGPRFRILVALDKDVATLTLDTTGIGLHKRGYRTLTAEAPLRETLAAALVSLARWSPDRVLADPLCGSGTIPIEAALIARNRAPGLSREFDSSTWPVIPATVWQEARAEAEAAIDRDVSILGISGSDRDQAALDMARYHAQRAGVASDVTFERRAVQDFASRRKYGVVVTNPPYGERLGEEAEATALYREMSAAFGRLETWSFFVLTSHPDFERHFGRVATRKRKLYNGRIRCDLYQYFGPLPAGVPGSR